MAENPQDDRDPRPRSDEVNSGKEREFVPNPPPHPSAEETDQELEFEDGYEATDN
jgi:hypothetical protein